MRLATTQSARHPRSTAKALALACLMFDRPDFERAERFLNDFGLMTVQRDESTLLLRGTGPAPFCYVARKAPKAALAGFGLQVTGHAALDAPAKLPDALTVESSDWPGGGYHVRLANPSSFRVDAIANRVPTTELPHRSALPLNSVDAPLCINETQRPPVDTPEVIRPGHVVLELASLQATCAWYTQHFGFIPSNVQVLPGGSPAIAFMRLDLGDAPADHHTLMLTQDFASKYGHSAFELIDADAIGVGHRMLRKQGQKYAWGLGRHILGSQIFDCWQDPWDDKHEHYCDGDLFTADQPTSIHPVSHEAMSQWRQSMSASFTKPKLTPTAITTLVRSLRRNPDLTLRKLVTLARVFA